MVLRGILLIYMGMGVERTGRLGSEFDLGGGSNVFVGWGQRLL